MNFAANIRKVAVLSKRSIGGERRLTALASVLDKFVEISHIYQVAHVTGPNRAALRCGSLVTFCCAVSCGFFHIPAPTGGPEPGRLF